MDAGESIDIDAPEVKGKGAKPRKRTPATPIRKDNKRSLNLRIDEESYERLAVHALRRKTTISALVEGFARENLREFSIHRNAGAKGE